MSRHVSHLREVIFCLFVCLLARCCCCRCSFEDLIFHQKGLISVICECAGAVPTQETFSYVVDAGKWGDAHKGRYAL
jgi:hypothetical protein